MQGILRFKLPEDQREFIRAQKATDYALVLWCLDEWLVKKVDESKSAARHAFELARKELKDLMAHHNVP
jgi:hypothetical protein